MEILRRVSKNIGKSSGLKCSAVVIYWIFRNVLHKVSILFCNSVLWHHILQHLNSLKWAIICDALRNLLPFKQFKKREKRFNLQLYYKYHTFMGNWNYIIWMLNPFFQKCCWNPMIFTCLGLSPSSVIVTIMLLSGIIPKYYISDIYLSFCL